MCFIEMKLQIQAVQIEEDIRTIHQLAWQILLPFYKTYLPEAVIRAFLEKYLSQKAIKEQINTGGEYYLLKIGQDIIGFLGIQCSDKELFLDKLYLLPASRGLGVGKSTMEFVFQLAQKRALDRISLYVYKDSMRTIAFYESYGFEIKDFQIFDFGDGLISEDYKMEKTLR